MAAGVKWTFAPMVDIARDPRWGRIVEGFGEDSFLGAAMSEAAVEGFQGDQFGEEDHIAACMKHFAAYGACEGGRDYNSVDMSMQTLHDVYLPPFIAGFQAGAAGVMTAFHDLNGIPCSANIYLLKDILRNECGFEGVIISDYNSVQDMVAHGYSESEEKAFEAAFAAGVDILMAGDGFNNTLPGALAEGRITERQIDEAALRVLTMKYVAGLFDNPYVDPAKENCFYCTEHRAVSREAGKKSIVLLENNGILPLKPHNIQRLAVIGPLADDKRNVLGPWHGLPEEEQTVTILDGLKEAFTGGEILYEKGCEIEGEDRSGIEAAVQVTKGAQAVVVVVGESIEMSGEARNRSDLSLPGVQKELIGRLAETGTPMIVLVSAGRPLLLADFKDTVSALLYIWQLGTETGHAVADVLTGRYNPSGRLSVSFPYSVGQLPVYYNHYSTGKPALEKVWYETKYLDAPIEPLYPFGYGMSYTSFEILNVLLSAEEMPTDGYIDVSCTIRNTGDYGGDVVVQLYVQDRFASRVRPVCELKGFCKIFVAAKEERQIAIRLQAKCLAFRDGQLNPVVEPGEYSLWMAFHSRDRQNGKSFFVR